MLRFDSSRHLLWCNPIASRPVFAGELSLGDAYEWTTAALSSPVVNALRAALPDAVKDGMIFGAAELVAALAQGFERWGDVTPLLCGVHARDAVRRAATVFFSCIDPYLGSAVLPMAVDVVERLTRSAVDAAQLEAILKSAKDYIRTFGLYTSTQGTIAAAERKGIPWIRPNPFSRHALLGQGARQYYIIDTVLGIESAIGRDFAKNKLMALSLLSQVGLPVGRFAAVHDAASALQMAEVVGYPLVLKPSVGSRGESVYVNLRNPQELRAVLPAARIPNRQYLIQSLFTGDDHRLVVVKGKLIAAAMRIPASVKGDGIKSVRALVDAENKRRVRPLISIRLDLETDRILERQGYTSDSIPPAGQHVQVRGTANMATGGTSVDVLDIIHPDNVNLAVRAAKALGMAVAGVDLICPDIGKSWHDVGGGICEINSTISLGPNTYANPEFDATGAVLEAVYPKGDDGRIPTALVMGKEADRTAAMLAAILDRVGHTVGRAGSDGVTIGSEKAVQGDQANAAGASIVLRDATVTAAVLEISYDAFVRSGSYLDICDAVALIDAQREDIEMVRLRALLKTARKAVILNADDPRCSALARECASSLRTILFSTRSQSETLRDHIATGADAVFLRDGHAIIIASRKDERTIDIAQLPFVADSAAAEDLGAALPVVALAIGLGVDVLHRAS